MKLLLLMVTSKGIAGVPRASLVVIAATLAHFNIPEAGVRAAYKKLQLPSLDEGFDAVFQVRIAENGGFSVHPLGA